MADDDAAEVKAPAEPDMQADEAAEVEAPDCTLYSSLVQPCHLRWIAVLQCLTVSVLQILKGKFKGRINTETWFHIRRIFLFSKSSFKNTVSTLRAMDPFRFSRVKKKADIV